MPRWIFSLSLLSRATRPNYLSSNSLLVSLQAFSNALEKNGGTIVVINIDGLKDKNITSDFGLNLEYFPNSLTIRNIGWNSRSFPIVIFPTFKIDQEKHPRVNSIPPEKKGQVAPAFKRPRIAIKRLG